MVDGFARRWRRSTAAITLARLAAAFLLGATSWVYLKTSFENQSIESQARR